MTTIDDAVAAPPHYLDSVEGEIALFRSLAQARPVGKHKHFHVLTVLQSIRQETGRNVTANALWDKLDSLYNLEYLDDLDRSDDELEEKETPPPSTNYNCHPRFRSPFELPADDSFIASLIADRRIKPLNEPSPSPPPSTEDSQATSPGPETRTSPIASSIKRQHGRNSSAASNAANTATNLGAFDSDGDLTEEDDGDNKTSTSGTGAAEEEEEEEEEEETAPRKKGKSRSQSVRTTRSEAAASVTGNDKVDDEDHEMADAQSAPDEEEEAVETPSGSATANTRSSKRAPAPKTKGAPTTASSTKGGRAVRGRGVPTKGAAGSRKK
ncbi:hypothetical protein FRB96_003651 [Tulasnella sp. 330]|nr:hypothetical protein FRB96_003651 [Tulasnella sp. 330]KAG8878565.1 hypothetical protein FRB97_002400 [Tulasnella sp. 331]